MKKLLVLIAILCLTLGILLSCGKTPDADNGAMPHTHDWGNWSIVSEAACEQEGLQERVCICGDKEQQKINALGHVPGEVATCEKSQDCTVCGIKLVNAKGHTEVIDEAVTATCITIGKTEGTHCSDCNKTLVAQQTIAAKGHSEVIDTAVAPTCTATGLTEGKHCSVCGEVLVAQKVVDALGHTEIINSAKSPTCTETGLTEGKYCSVCDEVLVEQKVVDVLGHTEVVDAAKAPTCTENGLTEGKHCSVCNEVLIAQKAILSKGHSFGKWVITQEPTETEKGAKRRDCVNCDAYETDVIAELAHDHSRWEQTTLSAVAPTCTATGLTEGKKCSGCGEILVAQQVVPANGHTEVIDVAVPATCTTLGKTEGKHCSVCNEIFVAQKTVEAKGHTEVIDQAVAATCTTNGKTEGTHCSVCNEVIIAQKVISAKGHTEVVDNAVAPTCTATGLTEGQHCSVCNEILVEQQVVAAKGHTEVIDKAVASICTSTGLTEGNHCSVCNEVLIAQQTVAAKGHTEMIVAAVPATCTTLGKTEGIHCSVCEEVIVAQKIISAKGHAEVIDKAVAPTCTENGLTEGKHCSVCNEVLIAQQMVAAKGHTEVIDEAVAPTCTEDGLTEGKHCSVCNEVLIGQKIDPATGHKYNYTSGTCDRTGCNYTFSIGLRYTSNKDGTCAVNGIGTCKDSNLIIPPVSPSGDKVTIIRANAFYGKQNLISIIFPDSLVSIEDYAFFQCTGLTSVTIPDGVKSIGVFSFLECTSLSSITIPDTVVSIGGGAFRNCTNLKSIAIPAGVSNIGDNPFAGCDSLVIITVDESNKVYYSDKNCIIEKSTNTLISGCNTSVIPDGVERIGNAAFLYCSGLKNIIIPASVKSIGNVAFLECVALSNVNIPNSIKSIGERAFANCTDLSSIVYDGKLSDWEAIEKGTTWDRDTANYTLYCNDDTKTKAELNRALIEAFLAYRETLPKNNIVNATVRIDGVLDDLLSSGTHMTLTKEQCDEWNELKAAGKREDDGAGVVGDTSLTGGANISFYFAYDDEYLYIIENRYDPNWCFTPDYTRPYMGDGSMLWFINSADAGTWISTDYKSKPTFGLKWTAGTQGESFGSNQPMISYFSNDNQINSVEKTASGAWKYALKWDNAKSSYVLEVAIPWSDLPITKADVETGNISATFITVDIVNPEVDVNNFLWKDTGYQMQYPGVNHWHMAYPLVSINNQNDGLFSI